MWWQRSYEQSTYGTTAQFIRQLDSLVNDAVQGPPSWSTKSHLAVLMRDFYIIVQWSIHLSATWRGTISNVYLVVTRLRKCSSTFQKWDSLISFMKTSLCLWACDVLNKLSVAAPAEHEVETIECNLIKSPLISTNCDGDAINGTLDNGDFWNLYSIKKSTPDGHCLLYSVVESLRSRKTVGKLLLYRWPDIHYPM